MVRCPYCRAELRETERTTSCPECRSTYHSECWRTNHGCAVFGCAGSMQEVDNLRLVRIYSCPFIPTAQYLVASLVRNGITCSIRNAFPAAASQSGLPPWPELWVSEADVEKGIELINLALSDVRHQKSWKCPSCGEKLGAQFTQCWKCGAIRRDRQAASKARNR